MTSKPDLAGQPQCWVSRRQRGGWPMVVALLVVSGLFGCSASTAGGSGERGASSMGSRAVKPTRSLYRNEKVSRKLAAISEKLATASGSTPVTVRVLNGSGANAALGPDGNIYLTRQLLLLTSDDSELAAVIAHEMAHKLSGHAAARENAGMQAAVSSDDIAKLLPDSGSVKTLLAEKSKSVAALSRQQELEADAMAIQFLAKAGYDPAAVGRFLKTMQANDEVRAAGRQTYTSIHPAPDMRIKRAESLAASL